MNNVDPLQAVALYNTGQFTVKQLARELKLSAGKLYYVLRDAGCIFTRKRRKPITEEERRKMSEIRKGRTISEKQRLAISERNSCHYNGLNGYGHTKQQNKGYVLVYVPDHPKAHSDGYVMFHTVLMERNLNRYLTDNEVVHHINHDRSDNRIENLMLMEKHEHRSMHMRERHEKRRNDLSIRQQ